MDDILYLTDKEFGQYCSFPRSIEGKQQLDAFISTKPIIQKWQLRGYTLDDWEAKTIGVESYGRVKTIERYELTLRRREADYKETKGPNVSTTISGFSVIRLAVVSINRKQSECLEFLRKYGPEMLR